MMRHFACLTAVLCGGDGTGKLQAPPESESRVEMEFQFLFILSMAKVAGPV